MSEQKPRVIKTDKKHLTVEDIKALGYESGAEFLRDKEEGRIVIETVNPEDLRKRGYESGAEYLIDKERKKELNPLLAKELKNRTR